MGSSSEGLAIAQAFKDCLTPEVECELWNDSIFVPGEYTLEALEHRSRAYDGALIVGTADDRLTSRGTEF